MLALYSKGEIAREARTLDLAYKTVSACDRILVERHFLARIENLPAGRSARGEPQWRLHHGGATLDPMDPGRVVVFVYVNLDGTMVRVFPLGDPLGRIVPANACCATKSVLFVPPLAYRDERGQEEVLVDTSFSNEAFRIDAKGEPVPRSHRAADGILEVSKTDRVENWRAAVRVVASGIFPLSPT